MISFVFISDNLLLTFWFLFLLSEHDKEKIYKTTEGTEFGAGVGSSASLPSSNSDNYRNSIVCKGEMAANEDSSLSGTSGSPCTAYLKPSSPMSKRKNSKIVHSNDPQEPTTFWLFRLYSDVRIDIQNSRVKMLLWEWSCWVITVVYLDG